MQVALPTLIGLLVVATGLAIGAKRARIPYNVALVVGGMLLAVSGLLPTLPRLDPAVVFLLCLPALLFEGGVSSDLRSIRRNAVPIGVLASLGILLQIGVSGLAFHLGLGLDPGPAFLLAAILGGTDTVSVLFAFRRVPAPTRLSGIMLGETLFNDAVTLVFYGAIGALVAGGEGFSAPALGFGVVVAMAGGAAVGMALGLLVALLIRWTHDPGAEIMSAAALAYGAYLVGDRAGVSGAIATVLAGIVVGESLRLYGSPQSRVGNAVFWDYAAFGVNTFLFLSVGLSTSLDSLVHHAGPSAIAFVCLTLGRVAAIYLPFLLIRWIRPTQAVPLRWQHVFVVGNIKGALTIAMALGLPADTPNRALLVDVAFGVTFVSMVGQGLLLPLSIRWLGLSVEDPFAHRIAEEQGKLVAARAAQRELEDLHRTGLVSRQSYDLLRSEYQIAVAEAERNLRELKERYLALGARLHLGIRRRLVDAERTALAEARKAGLIPEAAASTLLSEVDRRVLEIERLLVEEVSPAEMAEREEGARP